MVTSVVEGVSGKLLRGERGSGCLLDDEGQRQGKRCGKTTDVLWKVFGKY